MSEAHHLAEALEQLFTSDTHGWFTPFVVATDGLTAAQAAAVPADHFNSIWSVVNHVRFWQEAALHQLQGFAIDYQALGSEDGSGWPSAGGPDDEAAWQAARAHVVRANANLARYVASLTDTALGQPIAEGGQWNTCRHLIQSMIAHNSYHTCEIISIRHMHSWWFDAL